MKYFVLSLAALVGGCGSDCDSSACKKVDREARSGEFVVELDADTAFVAYQIDDFQSDMGLAGGELVFSTEKPSCVASSDNPCRITLERLRVELSSMTQPTTEGSVELNRPVVSLVAPLELVDDGGGFFLDPGRATVQTCVSVDGRPDSAIAPLRKPFAVMLDFENRTASFEGALPVRFRFGESECVEREAEATILATGEGPWVEAP
jgi:hypothetical protein